MLIRYLDLFIAVAEHGHIGRAASTRALSQPAVTKAMQRLEAEVGHPLLVRTPKGVFLTVEGNALLACAREVRLALAQGKREIDDLAAGHRGEVTLGLDPNLVPFFTNEVCPRLRGKSSARITATTDSNQNLVDALSRGSLDFVFGAYPSRLHEGVSFETLAEDRIVVVARKSHPARRLRTRQLRNLVQYSWAMADGSAFSRQRLEQTFAQNGVPPPRIAFESNSLPLILAAIANSDLLGYQPRYLLHEARTRYAVEELPTISIESPRVIGLITRNNGYRSPASLQVAALLRSLAASRLVRE